MNAYKDAEAYAAELVAKGYTPEGIIAFATGLIELAFTAHSANKAPDVVTNKDRIVAIEQAFAELVLITGLSELSQHIEATYYEEGLIHRSNTIDVDRMYTAVKLDGDGRHVNSVLNNAAWDAEYGDMGDERAMFVGYTPVYDEHYDNPKVRTLRETIAKHMANMTYPNRYFGTTY